jgi:hypothetical protein
VRAISLSLASSSVSAFVNKSSCVTLSEGSIRSDDFPSTASRISLAVAVSVRASATRVATIASHQVDVSESSIWCERVSFLRHHSGIGCSRHVLYLAVSGKLLGRPPALPDQSSPDLNGRRFARLFGFTVSLTVLCDGSESKLPFPSVRCRFPLSFHCPFSVCRSEYRLIERELGATWAQNPLIMSQNHGVTVV